jgi:hypothetical protein
VRVVSTAAAITLPEAVIRQGAQLHPEIDFAAQMGPIKQALEELAAQMGLAANS